MPKPEPAISHVRALMSLREGIDVWEGVVEDGRAGLKPALGFGLVGDELKVFIPEKGRIVLAGGAPEHVGIFYGDRMAALGEVENELRRRAAAAPVTVTPDGTEATEDV